MVVASAGAAAPVARSTRCGIAQLGIGEPVSHLSEARRRLGDDAQPEILTANEGPGRLRAFELGVGVVGEVAVELAREREQRLDRGAIERVGQPRTG